VDNVVLADLTHTICCFDVFQSFNVSMCRCVDLPIFQSSNLFNLSIFQSFNLFNLSIFRCFFSMWPGTYVATTLTIAGTALTNADELRLGNGDCNTPVTNGDATLTR